MKKIVSLFIFIAFNLFSSYAQEIISIEEKSSGRTIIIDGDDPIVDINSTLEIMVSKDNLRSIITSQYPSLSNQDDLEQELIALEEILVLENKTLSILKMKVTSEKDQNEFFDSMNTLFESVRGTPLYDKVNLLYEQFYDQNLDAQYKYFEIFLFENLKNDLNELQQRISETGDTQLEIRVVAFKKDESGGDRVHIQNFDTYKDREYLEIERWVTTLSQENQEKIKDIKDLASENTALHKDVFYAIKFSITQNFQEGKCIKDLELTLRKLVSDQVRMAKLSREIREEAADLSSELNTIIRVKDLLEEKLSQWDITTPFILSEQLQSLIASSRNFRETLITNANDIDKLIKNIPELANFRQDLMTCTNTFLESLDKLKSTLEFQKLQRANYIANKEIGEEVTKFGLDNLPAMGIIDLKKIGPRKNGDEIEINVMLRKPISDPALADHDILVEQKNLTMQMIGLHSEVAVGLIMANPFTVEDEGEVNNDRKFFYAPAASLLLKFGLRDSKFYNDFLKSGLGINFASPDFNINGDPEFGTGLIFTAFRDILSIGINYNVTLDVSYWFFGVNLPFNLPGLPVTGVGNID